MSFSVIIPDRGDRPEFLKHCLFQMDRQTLKPDTIYLIDYKPKNNKPDLIPRIKEGIRKAEADGFEYCYIIENDDYYPDDYFESMQFGKYDFVGIGKTIYYSLSQKMFTHRLFYKTRIGTCLSFTGFKISELEGFIWPRDDLILLDVKLWKYFARKGNYHLYFPENVAISIKHGMGLCVTRQHDINHEYEIDDKDSHWLKQNVRKESFEFYSSVFPKIDRFNVLQDIFDKIKGQTYLEIGIGEGNTFNKIIAPIKLGVDINPFIVNGIDEFYHMTSDRFFEKEAPLMDNLIDLVFIDGLHEFEQVVRDVQNSLKYLSPKGVIVLHDCNPQSEIIQAIPRKQAQWMGDVWKTIPFFRSILNRNIFVLNGDDGLGIIAPFGNSTNGLNFTAQRALELSYSDLKNNRNSLLNLKRGEYFSIFLECI